MAQILAFSLSHLHTTQWQLAHFLQWTKFVMLASQSSQSLQRLVNKVKTPQKQSSSITTCSKHTLTLKKRWQVRTFFLTHAEATLYSIPWFSDCPTTQVTHTSKDAKLLSKVATSTNALHHAHLKCVAQQHHGEQMADSHSGFLLSTLKVQLHQSLQQTVSTQHRFM